MKMHPDDPSLQVPVYPSQGPGHRGTETSYPLFALSEFLTNRIQEPNKLVVLCFLKKSSGELLKNAVA